MTGQSQPTSRALRRQSARAARVQYLIVADEHTFAELQLALATLPMCATGRVFVEVPDAAWVQQLDVPSRMTLTWLDRAQRGTEPGVALTRAATAWADESLCVEPEVRTQAVLMTGWCATVDLVEHLTERLDLPFASVDVPASFDISR